jgi:exosortase
MPQHPVNVCGSLPEFALKKWFLTCFRVGKIFIIKCKEITLKALMHLDLQNEKENLALSPPATGTNLVLLGTLLAAFLLAYFPVWKSLVGTWYRSDDYSHGFFIIPITLYIIWQKRVILAKTSVRSSPWGLFVILFALLLYLMGRLGEIATVASLSMVLALAGVVLYLGGCQFLKELAFPLFLLLFMIPVPAQIYSTLTIPLQLLVSQISTTIAGLWGIPVFREGNVIYLPDHTLEVVQACSGLRSMMSLLTLSAVFGYFTLRSNLLRSILLVFSVPAAIIVNIVRVLVMIAAFYYFDFDLTSGTTHTVFGVVIFCLALFLVGIMRGVLALWEPRSAREGF